MPVGVSVYAAPDPKGPICCWNWVRSTSGAETIKMRNRDHDGTAACRTSLCDSVQYKALSIRQGLNRLDIKIRDGNLKLFCKGD